MIAGEDKWLDALQARNNVAHSYNEYFALDIVRQTKTTFLGLFQELKIEVEEKWMLLLDLRVFITSNIKGLIKAMCPPRESA